MLSCVGKMLRRRTLVSVLVLAVLTGCAGTKETSGGMPSLRYADVNGTRLAYVEQGSGMPVVFIHGAVGDLRYWELWREPVARQYRYIALTLRYFGDVPTPQGGPKFSPGLHAEDTAAFIRQLGVGPVVLVGQSHGATVALITAALHGELVSGIFINEPGIGSLITDPAERKIWADDIAKAFPPVAAMVKQGDNAKAARMLIDAVNDDPNGFDRLPPERKRMILENAHSMGPMFNGDPAPQLTCEQLQRYPGRAVVARGESTRPLFRIQTEAVLRCLRRGKALVAPGGRHGWLSGNPELFSRELAQFLASL